MLVWCRKDVGVVSEMFRQHQSEAEKEIVEEMPALCGQEAEDTEVETNRRKGKKGKSQEDRIGELQRRRCASRGGSLKD